MTVGGIHLELYILYLADFRRTPRPKSPQLAAPLALEASAAGVLGAGGPGEEPRPRGAERGARSAERSARSLPRGVFVCESMSSIWLRICFFILKNIWREFCEF